MLYRYRNIGDTENKIIDFKLSQFLKEGKLYLSNPKKFNDPYDCNFKFELPNDINFLKKFFSNYGLTECDIENKFRKLNIEDIKKELYDIFQQKDLTRICCFSINETEPLMWAHYAQSHYGICIGFKTYISDNQMCLNISDYQVNYPLGDYKNNLFPVFKVEYTNSIHPTIILSNPNNGDFFRSALLKSKQWEYENEYRIVISTRNLKNNPVHIKRTEIKEVIFGIRTPIEMQDEIREYLIEFDIDYYKIHKNESGYLLEKKPIA